MWTSLRFLLPGFVVAASLLTTSCDSKQQQAAALARNLYIFDTAKALHKDFEAAAALNHLKAQVAFGPRPAGSEALGHCRAYLTEQLQNFGWEVQPQAFKEYTSKGEIEFINLRARLPIKAEASKTWERPFAMLIGSHYDTKLFGSFTFVGANDGASSTAVLLEMARVLGKRPDAGQFVELVFFDGEEALIDYTPDASGLPKDGLFGSRHYAKIMRGWPKIQQPLSMFLLDMVGDKDLLVKIPTNSTPILSQLILASAAELNLGKYFAEGSGGITDDHVPFLYSGIPSVDIIDLNYSAWHTSSDALDQVSEESLSIVGRTTLLALEKYLATSAMP